MTEATEECRRVIEAYRCQGAEQEISAECRTEGREAVQVAARETKTE